jgi:DNA-binding transcriptional LysR family regulator
MKPSAGSPVVGYNTGVQHGGKNFHIQTEDSGCEHPHVITHLFADGGRVIATRKTDYRSHVGSDSCAAMVKEIVLAQHKAMFVALRDGRYDAIIASGPDVGLPRHEPPLEIDELERALHRAHRSSLADDPARTALQPATSGPPPSATKEPVMRKSAPRIPITDPTDLTIDDVILAELTALLAESD